jgi:glyceraldehyde-3-phosphate dehydrogenase/erythrose-4-phosphate dehydrogenase
MIASAAATPTFDPTAPWAERPVVSHIGEANGGMPSNTLLFPSRFGGDTPTSASVQFTEVDSVAAAAQLVAKQTGDKPQSAAVLQASTGQLYVTALGTPMFDVGVTDPMATPRDPSTAPEVIAPKHAAATTGGRYMAEVAGVQAVIDAAGTIHTDLEQSPLIGMWN